MAYTIGLFILALYIINKIINLLTPVMFVAVMVLVVIVIAVIRGKRK